MKVYPNLRKISFFKRVRRIKCMGGLSFLQKLIFLLNILFAIALLMACIVPHTTSASLAFFSLAVPMLVAVNICFLIYWIIGMKRQFMLSLVTLFMGYFLMGNFIGFSSKSNRVEKKDSFSILSFNSLGFRGNRGEWRRSAGDSIVKFIAEEDPDILCFQEFKERKGNVTDFEPYAFKAIRNDQYELKGGKNLAIFSKHRIIESDFILFPNTYNGAMYADIVIHQDTLRIYNVHLESFGVRPNSIKRERSDRLFKRLRTSFARQKEQSDIVRKHINNSPYPSIVCGDLNSTQFSHVYLNIKKNLKDTFLEKGTGLGSTIHFWKFPFRIDYILVDLEMKVLSHTNYSIGLSDHEPIMASVQLGTHEQAVNDIGQDVD